MIVKVQKQGDEFTIPIPDELAEKLKWTENTKVRLILAEDMLIIKRAPQPRFTLAELLEGVTPENKHEEFDFGPPVGKEIFWED